MKKLLLSFILLFGLLFYGVLNASGLSSDEKNKYSNLMNKIYISYEGKYTTEEKLIEKIQLILNKVKYIKKVKYDKLNSRSKDLINLIEESLEYRINYYKEKIKNRGENLNFSDIFADSAIDDNSNLNSDSGDTKTYSDNMISYMSLSDNIPLLSFDLIDGNNVEYYIYANGKKILTKVIKKRETRGIDVDLSGYKWNDLFSNDKTTFLVKAYRDGKKIVEHDITGKIINNFKGKDTDIIIHNKGIIIYKVDNYKLNDPDNNSNTGYSFKVKVNGKVEATVSGVDFYVRKGNTYSYITYSPFSNNDSYTRLKEGYHEISIEEYYNGRLEKTQTEVFYLSDYNDLIDL